MKLPLVLVLIAFGCGDSTTPADAGNADSGTDAATDAGVDASSDSGSDDAGSDAGSDAGPVDAPTPDTSIPDTSVPCVGEGEACRDPIVAEWTDCRYTECANEGERSRTTTAFICREGRCMGEFVVETDPSDCMRDSTNLECMAGGLNNRCCNETCTDLLRTDTHCGACGITCPATSFCNGVRLFGGQPHGACVLCETTVDCTMPGNWTCRSATGDNYCECVDATGCGAFADCVDGFCQPR